jgi:hypothetical protein
MSTQTVSKWAHALTTPVTERRGGTPVVPVAPSVSPHQL